MPDAQDMDLVREFARHNSEAAFTELVQRHIALVYSVARRCTGNDGDAQDVTQAVFIILARKAAGLRERTLLPGWLYETTRFTAARLLRTNARRQTREQEAYMQSTLNEAGTADVWEKLSPHLEAAMSRLAERDRALLVLRFYQNKSGPEAAALMGIREDAAHKRISRALEKLRKFFTKRGVDSTASTIAETISANSVQAAPVALAKAVTAVAIAKGATASLSTLTLIQGALKIMAWTKAKTAIVASAAAILLVGTPTVVIIAAWPAPDISGTWVGTLLLQGAGVHAGESPKTRLVINITKVNGVYQVSGDSLDQGIRGVQIVNFSYKHSRVHAETPNSTDLFDGTVNRAGTEVSGKWKENNETNAFNFKRTTNPPPFPEPLADADFVPRAGSALQGFWKGVIKTGGNGLEVNIKIAEDADGTFRADFYVPPQGGFRQPTSVSYDGTKVKLMPMAGYGMFQGALSNDGKAMTGDWVQGGNLTPTTFTRAN
jgi:RNA polymerase sigma factor (sigma-70 family)